MTVDDESYWYEHRHELVPGMVFKTANIGLVKLDSRVPGDGTRWYVANWWNDSWAWLDTEIEPGDLRGWPLEDIK